MSCAFCCLRRFFFFFPAEDGIRDPLVTGVQTCALPISLRSAPSPAMRERVPSEARRVRVLAANLPSPSQRFALGPSLSQIGRASCREKVQSSVYDVTLNKQKHERYRKKTCSDAETAKT